MNELWQRYVLFWMYPEFDLSLQKNIDNEQNNLCTKEL